MIGFIVFLICLLIIVILIQLILNEIAPGNQKIRMIVFLVVLLFAILWLFGGGGWTYVHTWKP